MAAASIEPEAVGLEQATTSWKAITDSCMGSALWAQRHQLLRSIHVWQYILRNRVGLYIFILQEYKYVLTWVVASYEMKFKHRSIRYCCSSEAAHHANTSISNSQYNVEKNWMLQP
jgi:hypothetical protein